MNIKNLVVLSVLLLTVGCLKKDAAVVAASGSGATGLTSTQVAGTRYSTCRTSGSLPGVSYYNAVTLQSNGNYNYSLTVVDSLTCALGATELIRYTQFGTFSMEGLASSPSGATKIKFNVGSSVLSTPDATWRTYFNSTVNCGTPTFNLVGSSNNTNTISNRTCNSFSTFPVDLGSYYNVVSLSGTSIQMKSFSTLWDSGSSVTYPASVDLTFSP